MSKIITITLNPALDKNTSTSRIKPDSKLRCDVPEFEPGGGGINVARAVHQLGGEALAIFPSGGPGGAAIEELLKQQEITFKSLPIKAWTRENLNVNAKETGEQFRFIMPGAEVTTEELENLKTLIRSCGDFDFLVLSGSLPENCPDNIYTELSKVATEHDAKCIIDTSGMPLHHAFNEGHIFLAKPNSGELSKFVGKQIESPHDLEIMAKHIINEGHVDVLVVSLGPQGALLVTKDISEQVIPPVVKKLSTVGAGDSMVAGITYKLSQGGNIREALRYGIACGTAATMNFGSELCQKEDVEKLFSWIMERYPITNNALAQ